MSDASLAKRRSSAREKAMQALYQWTISGNNLRDIESDRKANKRTMAVRLGVRGTRIEYLLCLVISYLAVPAAALVGLVPWLAMTTWVSLPKWLTMSP